MLVIVNQVIILLWYKGDKMGTIEEKYNICYIGRKRYYLEDLTKRNYSVKCAIPYYFCYRDIRWYESSWKSLIFNVALELNLRYPKSDAEYLSLENDWGKQKVFSEHKSKNYERFNNLYINLNHTAVHALWTLQLLLEFFGVDLSECKLYLSRHGSAEPKEAQKYFQDITVNGLKKFLADDKGLPEEKIALIIKNLFVVNRCMPSLSLTYNNLFLFDDSAVFAGYKDRLCEYLRTKAGLSEQKLATISKHLNYLKAYYYKTYNSVRNEDIF